MASEAYRSPVDFLVRYNLLWLEGLLHKFIHAVLLLRSDNTEMALMKQLQFLPKSEPKETEQIYNFRSCKLATKD